MRKGPFIALRNNISIRCVNFEVVSYYRFYKRRVGKFSTRLLKNIMNRIAQKSIGILFTQLQRAINRVFPQKFILNGKNANNSKRQ